jgi:restriction system protein
LINAGNQQWGTAALISQWKHQRDRQFAAAAATATLQGVSATLQAGNLSVAGHPPEPLISTPELMFGALVEKGDATEEGHIILALTPAYRLFLDELARDPNAFYLLRSWQLEELVAGQYEREGCRVVLTKRTRDGGRDVIATRDDFGTIRIVDQVKLYKPQHVVGIDEVRELWGVLNLNERGASKGIITTTSRFALGVEKDRDLAAVMPGRLTLRNGAGLLEWLFKK